MDKYNLILIGFIIAAVFLALWWAFNTIRRIDAQKNFSAMSLTSVAKLWHRAKFVPEDAKERESLYLYRDFLRKFDENECQYPIMVKDGKVRCMTRKEYDNLCGQKTLRPVSILIFIISIMIAAAAVYVDFYLNKKYWLGVGLSLILPGIQSILAIFVARFNKEKNNYRDGIFMALKENSVAFLSITKPFIIVDAYPDKFGKDKQPLYATIGELTNEQVIETRDFIVRQKAAETKVVISNIDNTKEIKQITDESIRNLNKKNVSATITEDTVENVADEQAVLGQEVSVEVPTVDEAPIESSDAKSTLTTEESEILINNLINDALEGEVNRAIKEVEEAEKKAQENTQINETVTEVQAPAEDDFSLEAIGQALDAEIEKRSKNRRR